MEQGGIRPGGRGGGQAMANGLPQAGGGGGTDAVVAGASFAQRKQLEHTQDSDKTVPPADSSSSELEMGLCRHATGLPALPPPAAATATEPWGECSASPGWFARNWQQGKALWWSLPSSCQV